MIKEINLDELKAYRQPDVAFCRVIENDPVLFVVPAVYFLYGRGELLYIGKTKNLSERVCAHYHDKKIDCDEIKFVIVKTEAERKLIERNCILKFNPKL